MPDSRKPAHRDRRRPVGHIQRWRRTAVWSAVVATVLLGAITVSAAFAARTPGLRRTASIGTQAAPGAEAQEWITTPNHHRFASAVSPQATAARTGPPPVKVSINTAHRDQRIVGFGAALTDSSAELLQSLPARRRTSVLRSLFAPGAGAGIRIVRVVMGASDFAPAPYSYDDLPPGRTDPRLTDFSIAHDRASILPVLRRAISLDPRLVVVASPWSAPAWMKTSDSLNGGTLAPDEYRAYARYFVRFLRAYAAAGVPVSAVSAQNEPGQSAGDYPSMTLTAAQEARFIGDDLGPALARAGLSRVKILGYDQNWSDTAYPTALLHSSAAHLLYGTAFHCYAGSPGAQTTVHDAAPGKAIWMTECSGGAWSPDFAENLGWDSSNLLVGSVRDWASAVIFWNIALNPSGGPHDGGCPDCRGVVTIRPNGSVSRNVEFAELAQANSAVSSQAVRVASPASTAGIKTVAFVNQGGSRAIILDNTRGADRTVEVLDRGRPQLTVNLPAGATVSLRWRAPAADAPGN